MVVTRGEHGSESPSDSLTWACALDLLPDWKALMPCKAGLQGPGQAAFGMNFISLCCQLPVFSPTVSNRSPWKLPDFNLVRRFHAGCRFPPVTRPHLVPDRVFLSPAHLDDLNARGSVVLSVVPAQQHPQET